MGDDQQDSIPTDFAAPDVEKWLANPEWPAFRGEDRSGRQHGSALSSDWSTTPPEQIWKVSVGPGWSSFAVAGKLLFTQEQRGSMETTVCYSADSGNEVWKQQIESRFEDSLGGPGPRATPTLADGAGDKGGTCIAPRCRPLHRGFDLSDKLCQSF